jgi:hypothetical protein
MDPSLVAIRKQGNKASESTTDGDVEIFRIGEKQRAAHPGGWAAHLYCIGDETLNKKLGGESGAAIARMKRFGVHPK